MYRETTRITEKYVNDELVLSLTRLSLRAQKGVQGLQGNEGSPVIRHQLDTKGKGFTHAQVKLIL